MSLFESLSRPNVKRMRKKGDVRGLIKALGYRKDAQVRLAAIEALKQIADEDAITPLINFLRDAEKSERKPAAETLKQIITTADEKRTVRLPAEESAREGYQAAIALWTYQGALNWSRFNVMLTANSIILAVIGVAFTSQRPLPVIAQPRFQVIGTVSLDVFTLLGLFLCAIWFLLTVRGYDWHRYWGYTARELEERYLASSVKTVSQAQRFHSGAGVSLLIGGKPTLMRMRWWSRLAGSQRGISYLVTVVFVIVYIVTLFQG